jgi:hypothetical protein
MNLEQKKRLTKYVIFLLVVLTITLLVIPQINVLADDDDNGDDDDGLGLIGEDLASDIGYITIGLFGAGMINVVVLYIYKITRRFLDDEGRSGKVKNFTREAYLKTRKPLNYLHYLLTFAGTTIILLHGIEFIKKDEEVGVFGWIATAVFLFYIVTGALIKLRIKPLWTSKKARKVLNWSHRSIVVFLVVIAVHIVHIIMAD